MNRDNKKALYESIMASVAKEVKKALNEGRLPKISEEELKKQNEILKALEDWYYEYGDYENIYSLSYEPSEIRWMRQTFYDEFWNNCQDNSELEKISKLCSYSLKEIDKFIDTHEKEIMKALRTWKRDWL